MWPQGALVLPGKVEGLEQFPQVPAGVLLLLAALLALLPVGSSRHVEDGLAS